MKNKSIFNKIFIIICLVLFISILTLIILGSINRKGYLSEFQLDESLSNISGYSYKFRIKYYSKIFRNSDIYNVYADTDKIIQNNNFIKEIKFNEKGTPFGTLTSSKELNTNDKIDNINYKLKIKLFTLLLFTLSILLIYLFTALIIKIIKCKNRRKSLVELPNNIYVFYIKYKKHIFILYSLIMIVFILFIIINSNIKYKSKLSNLDLIAESDAGYVYKAKIEDYKDNKLFSIDNNSIQLNNTNDIKYYGYALEITNKPLGSWHSTNIYYTDNNTFVISNEFDDENAYYYNIQVPTYIGDKYKITILAKQVPDNGVIKWHLNGNNWFKGINKKESSNDYIVLTDTREIINPADGNLDLHLMISQGVTEIESIFIESANGNLNSDNGYTILTLNEEQDNLNDFFIYFNLKSNNKILYIIIIIYIILFTRNKFINVKLSNIMIIGYIYLILPYILFLITWTKYYISIPIILLLLIGIYFLFKDTIINYNKSYIFNLFSLIVLLCSVILIVILLGIGNICTPDHDTLAIREACFRDLINFKWPLIYPKSGYGYVYYFAHWVIPALFGKILGYNFAQIMLILWTSIPIFFTIMLISMYFNKYSNKYIFIITFIFVLHAPLSLVFNSEILFTYFSSFLGNVSSYYNQGPAIYLMSMLFLHQKNSCNFAFIGLSIGFYSPYAVIGIISFMIVKSIIDIYNNGYIELKNIFSVSNIVFSLTIFPILFLYLSSSTTTSDGLKFILSEYKLFYLLELFFAKFMLLYILLFKYNKKNYLFYVSFFTIVIVSFIKYSGDHNFHRVNTTSLFFLTIFLIDYFFNYLKLDTNNIRKYLIISIFVIGIFRSYHYSLSQFDFYLNQIKSFGKVYIDDILLNKTFNTTRDSWQLKTITCQNMDESIFFKYIAKDRK